MSPLWVFAYGSLIWDPGFSPARREAARLDGWQRRFCVRSLHYRGTSARPGLVLALDAAPGQSCAGVALAAPAGEEAAVLAGLRARELARDVYLEVGARLRLGDGAEVDAITYVANTGHDSYCLLDPAEQARTIARAEGERGPNRDYLRNTLEHLRALGIADPELQALGREVRRLDATSAIAP